MSVEVVYRTTDPEIKAAWDAFCEAYKRWQAACLSFAAEQGEGREPIIMSGWGDRRLAGLSHKANQLVPDGWRIVPRSWPQYIVPLRKTKAGRELSDRMQALRLPAWTPPAMPDSIWTGNSVFHPGMETHGGVLYIVWGTDIESSKIESGAAGFSKEQFDPARWERVKLSEFYAAREAEEGRDLP
jgi:hypothetical protein